MKRVEITYTSKVKELEKLTARLERAEAKLQKAQAKAEKFGVATMTCEEHNEWLTTVPTEDYRIINDADVKKNGAWFDLRLAKSNVEELQRKVEIAERNLDKAEQKLNEYHEELEKIEDLKEKERLYQLELEEEKKIWAKDGIKLEDRYFGTTPKGNRFCIRRNYGGYTLRTLHCYTLYINNEVIFTSGEFWRAYANVKNR